MEPDIRAGDIVNEIGNELAYILDSHPDGSFLYSEAAEGTCSAGIFLERDGQVFFFNPTDELFNLIQDLWDIAEPEKKWSVLEYDVINGQAEASFAFPEQMDPEETEDDRRQRALRKRFGDKPVIYPDSNPCAVELTLDDLAHLHDDEEK